MKEKEIADYKLINNQLIEDNTKKQEKISELMENSQQESFVLTLENLKQEIKQYKNQINDLTKKNNELNEKLKKNNTINQVDINYLNKKKFLETDEELELNELNNNFNKKFNSNNFSKFEKIGDGGPHIDLGGEGIGDGDQNFLKYKERIKEYKEEINLLLMQINTLKDEIKQCQIKLNKPIVQNYDEFVKLFNLAFIGYKPFRKDQNEALELIKQKFISSN
jgi:gas vesicle protein